MLTLKTSIEELSRVGRVTGKRLKKLGLRTAEDLLFYFPFRHEDWRHIVPISKLTYGSSATCRGRVEIIKNTRSYFKRKNITEALVSDDSGSIKVVWFNQPYLAKILKIGDEIFLSGRVDFDRYGLHLTSPAYEKFRRGEETMHTARIVPIYSLVENLTNKQLRFLMKSVIHLGDKIKDWLPEETRRFFKLVDLREALRQIHFPENMARLAAAKRRLKFDEIFLIQLKNSLLRAKLQQSVAPKIIFNEDQTKKFTASLPFKLTNAQRRAAWEILQDLAAGKPMNRLLEGDVGSGKTVVAAVAILNTVLDGYQTVFMAPTEILAKQHFSTLSKLFTNWPFRIGLLTRGGIRVKDRSSISDIKKEKFLEFSAEGKIDIIVGTHALIQEGVCLSNLGLAIVDEQHRFGVHQRQALKNEKNGMNPHFLSMTATPIPRTVSLIFYGDLDLSVIDELPVGRKKILTKIVAPEKRQAAYNFIRKEVRDGRQVFVICPLIDESDRLGVKSAKEEYKKLSREIFPDLKVGLLHGRMKAEDKESAIQNFSKNKINILVSTSVVEVGVDIPNATVMMIEGAERFGLAQLHQFRGRVGRSNFQSYCLLFTDSESPEAIKRLGTLVGCDNGFALAEKDLEFRGPGEIWGTRQHGLPDFRIASLTDYSIIKEAKEAAEKIIKKDPALANFPDLKDKLENFEHGVHLE